MPETTKDKESNKVRMAPWPLGEAICSFGRTAMAQASPPRLAEEGHAVGGGEPLAVQRPDSTRNARGAGRRHVAGARAQDRQRAEERREGGVGDATEVVRAIAHPPRACLRAELSWTKPIQTKSLASPERLRTETVHNTNNATYHRHRWSRALSCFGTLRSWALEHWSLAVFPSRRWPKAPAIRNVDWIWR